MIRCKPGDVVLVRFPFTDLTSAKRRPAVVVSPTAYSAQHGDVVVLPLTSQPQRDAGLRLEAWSEAGLPVATWIKPLLGTLSASLVGRRIGKVATRDRPRITRALKVLIASDFLTA